MEEKIITMYAKGISAAGIKSHVLRLKKPPFLPESFEGKWDGEYPKIVKLRNAATNLSIYLKYPEASRLLIYTTNAIEGLNRQRRKAIN